MAIADRATLRILDSFGQWGSRPANSARCITMSVRQDEFLNAAVRRRERGDFGHVQISLRVGSL
jgi:hypothetical protein